MSSGNPTQCSNPLCRCHWPIVGARVNDSQRLPLVRVIPDIHGALRASRERTGALKEPIEDRELDFGMPDSRDLRDPETLGKEILSKGNGNP
jgi:hypothetical protein